MTLAYQMTFAGIPFALDKAKVFRVRPDKTQQGDSGGNSAPQQEDVDLMGELNQKIPFDRLDDVQSMTPYPGRGLLGLGLQAPACKNPYTNVKIGEWYYPTAASRWSIFRGLATSSMVKQMLAATTGNTAKTFVMKCTPHNLTGASTANYTLSTSMFMLPPRPLAELGGRFDGLYLVTLVDERYYWQDTPLTLNVDWTTTWASLLTQVATALGVTISTASAIETVYSSPEPDSALWLSNESSSVVLDCIAANIGRVLVRTLSGSYVLYTPAESRTLVTSNRTLTKDVRTAGGDLFQTSTTLPAGSLSDARNSVVPTSVTVSFPKYVTGNDPVPHFMNSRYGSQRPTSWNEDAYSDVYTVTVPIASGGPLVAGLTGTSTTALRDTAKAFYPTEATTTPTNASGLTSLAMRIARDMYENQVAAALDEVFPGTLAWSPEGLHDLIWTYSAKAGGAFLRVLRTTWNSLVRDFQHAPHALLGYTQVPAGEGGHSVAQTHRDSESAVVQTTLSATLLSGGSTLSLSDGTSFPQSTRWKAQIDTEVILCEGMSGGSSCSVVARGIDNSLQVEHSNGSTVTQIVPNTTYGVNLVEYGPGFIASPGKYTTGGVRGVYVTFNPTVSGMTFNYSNDTFNYNSGVVINYNTGGTYNYRGGSYNVLNSINYTISSGVNLTYGGTGRVVYDAPLEVCGAMFWCSITDSLVGETGITYQLPAPPNAKIVLRLRTTGINSLRKLQQLGIADPENREQVVGILNAGSGLLTLLHGGSFGTDFFSMPSESDITLKTNEGVIVWKDIVDGTWRPFMYVPPSTGGAAVKYDQYFWNSNIAVTVSGSLSGYIYMGGHPRIGFPGSSTASIGSGQIYAVPFINGRSGVSIRDIAFNVAGVPPANARAIAGIYTNTSDSDLRPNTLVASTAELDVTSTGSVFTSISGTIMNNDMYWLVLQSKFLSTFRFLDSSMALLPVLGLSLDGNTGSFGWYVDATYTGTLPATFDSAPRIRQNTGAVVPAIGLTFNA